jgi:acyl-CoA thioesterase-1
MKNLIFLVITLISIQAWSQDRAADEKKRPIKILFLGDSLTAGYGVEKEQAYPALVEKELNKKYSVKVLNGGVSGSTTASGLSRLRWFLKAKPDILVLILGANDGLRGVKLDESKKNLEKIILKAKAEGLKIILAGMMLPPNYGKEYTEKFKKMYIDLKEKYELPWIPFILKDVAGLEEMNIEDGIHPNNKGHEKVAKNLIPYLEPHL